MLSALNCFVAIARFHGLSLAVERMAHDLALTGAEDPLAVLPRVCAEYKLRMRRISPSWEQLSTMTDGFPLMGRLADGRWVIVSGFRPSPTGGEVVIRDVLNPVAGFQFLGREAFQGQWGGVAVQVRKRLSLAADGARFGLGWFLSVIRQQSALLRNVVIAALVLHIFGVTIPFFFQLVIDKVLAHGAMSTLWTLTIGVTIAIVFEAAFTFLRRYLMLHATIRVDRQIGHTVFAHLLSLSVNFFERLPGGVLIRNMQQADKVREFLTGRLLTTLLDSAAVVIYLPIMFLISVKLALIVLLGTCCIAAVIGVLAQVYRRRLRALNEAEGQRQAFLTETVHGMATVKTLALEPQQLRQWNETLVVTTGSHFSVGSVAATAQAVAGLIDKAVTVAVVAVGAADTTTAMTVGALVGFQMLAGRVSAPLLQFVSLLNEYQEILLSVEMLGGIMEAAPERRANQIGGRPPIRGQIEFDKVSFSYEPGRPPALNRLSFRVPAGGIFGIVGASGSGKTTITRLLLGLHVAQEGTVRLDGTDLREIDLTHLRSSIGTVLQENMIFRRSIADNIAVAKPGATFDEIVEAARGAGALEFIERLPRGFDTPLDEAGSNLSGGQRQRLAIARALLRNPRLIILDEATSALDPESEAIIQGNLRHMAKGRTMVVVSHRLSTLVDADTILVLDKGEAVGMGRHADLLSTCAVYRNLWQRQSGGGA